jgi:methylenetetrahydrofolate reductase (NADPH)
VSVVAPRFEILPFSRAEEEAAALPEPAVLTVTCSPRHGPDQAVQFGSRLRELGHTVVAHIAARMVRDRDHADALLWAMADAGIEDAFVIGGDTSPPQGVYSSAGELLEVIAEHPRRPASIGIAAYPEGHPLIDEQTLRAALEHKAAFSDYMTTQICFDPKALMSWLRETRRRGCDLPLMIGLPGEVDRRGLIEVSMRIGVGPSLSFLRKQRGLRQLLRRGSTADRLFDALAPCMNQPELRVIGLHYFTFNQLLDTWHWERQKRESWRLVVGS